MVLNSTQKGIWTEVDTRKLLVSYLYRPLLNAHCGAIIGRHLVTRNIERLCYKMIHQDVMLRFVSGSASQTSSIACQQPIPAIKSTAILPAIGGFICGTTHGHLHMNGVIIMPQWNWGNLANRSGSFFLSRNKQSLIATWKKVAWKKKTSFRQLLSWIARFWRI